MSLDTKIRDLATRVGEEIKSVRLSMAVIDDVTASTSKVYSSTKTDTQIATAVSAIVGLAPGTLDTLNELAAALGDDPNFATTMTTSIATKAPLNNPAFTGTVSGVSKGMVGLGNVDNTSDANKPVSTAQQSALGAKANSASPTFTGMVSGVTKAHVGLASVDNTSDAAKPVSTAQQNALNLKANTNNVVSLYGNETIYGAKYFQNTPSTPTRPAGSNDTYIATTAFVQTEVAGKEPLAPVRNRAVFVGSSNVVSGATMWPQKLCIARGWTMHNYAIGGSAYTNSNNFYAQTQSAIAGMTPTQRLEVGHFFVADASNNSRAKTPASDVLTAASALYAHIRTNFPNARIVVLPQIWPSDTEKYAPLAFAYEIVWNAFAVAHGEVQKEALADFDNSLFIDESWTWLTGLDGYMNALRDVHPNAAGNTLIAKLVSRALDGETITSSQPWTEVTVSSSATIGGRSRKMSARRRGWTVSVDGSAKWNSGSGSNWDIATLPYGMRPTYNLPVLAQRADTFAYLPCELWPNGAVRIYQALPANTVVWVSSTFQLG